MRNKLIILLGILIMITAGLGVFYTNGGKSYEFTNLYGDTVTIYGDGIYAANSMLKAATTKGTDIAALIFSIGIILCTYLEKKKNRFRFYKTGLLTILLYIAAYDAMGITYNRLFLIYVIEFSLALYLLLFELSDLLKKEYYRSGSYDIKFKGTAIFTMNAGCSVLIWLTLIIPATLNGIPFESIEIYTSEPTFAWDLGIIFPACIMSGWWLHQKRRIGYYLTPVLLTLLTCTAISVILQTVVQIGMGVILQPGQYIGLVGSFVILGSFAVVINHKLLKNVV